MKNDLKWSGNDPDLSGSYDEGAVLEVETMTIVAEFEDNEWTRLD